MRISDREIISHEGVVTGVSGHSVTVTISAQSACSGCHAKGSCINLGTDKKIVEVEGNYRVKTGDIVNVMMSQSTGFTALAYGYLLPFITVITLLVVLGTFGIPELTAGLLSLGALAPYYLVLYLFRTKLNKKFTFTISK